MKGRTGRASERGTIFIETLIAAAIVALVAAMSFQTIAAAAARGRQIEARREALLVAQSRLSAIQGDRELAAGDATGADGPFVWRTEVTPSPAGNGDSQAGTLAEVSVSVRDAAGGPELAGLKSLVLLPAPAS